MYIKTNNLPTTTTKTHPLCELVIGMWVWYNKNQYQEISANGNQGSCNFSFNSGPFWVVGAWRNIYEGVRLFCTLNGFNSSQFVFGTWTMGSEKSGYCWHISIVKNNMHNECAVYLLLYARRMMSITIDICDQIYSTLQVMILMGFSLENNWNIGPIIQLSDYIIFIFED